MSFTISEPFIPSKVNMPLDARTVVENESDILDIKVPYEGMLVYCKSNKKVYKITSLRAIKIGPIESADECAVDSYEEFVSGSVGGSIKQVQSDWEQVDDTAVDFIKNKPDVVNSVVLDYVSTTTNTIESGDASVTAYISDNSNGEPELSFEFTIPKGQKGDKGDTGSAGYTPERGTDYWTENDISAINSYIDETINNVLLNGEW